MSRTTYLLLLPLFGALLYVVFFPVSYTSYLSLTSKDGQFVGLSNYIQIALDRMFLNSVVVSLFYSIGSTVLALSIGVLLSFLLSLKIRGRGFFEALLIMPVAVPPIVVGVLWSPSAVWDDINTFIHFVIGFPYINLLSPFVYFPIMILSEAWEWAPLIMLVAISIISSQPKEINEVASLHGATSWQVFRKINLPTILRSPVMQFVVVLRFIDAMRAFEIPFTWSSWLGYQQSVGSPVDTLSLYLYKLMFLPIYNLPSSFISAVAISLLVVTLLGASILIRLMRVIVGPT